MYHYNSNYETTTPPKVTVSISLTPILVLLQIIFIVLKLCGAIAWGWVYVCIPAMIIGGIWVLTLLVILVVFIAALIIAKLDD